MNITLDVLSRVAQMGAGDKYGMNSSLGWHVASVDPIGMLRTGFAQKARL